MKVHVKNWKGSRVMNLDEFLTPSGYHGWDSGQVERAQEDANKACEAMGRPLSKLVEKEVLTLEEAQSIAGAHDDAILL